MEDVKNWIALVASPSLLAAVIWLAKKLFEQEKKVDKTDRAIKEIIHTVTLVVNDDTKAIQLMEIAQLQSKLMDILVRVKKLEERPENNNFAEELKRVDSLFKSYHEVCYRFHAKIQTLLTRDKMVEQNLKEIYLKLATIKRL